MFEHVEPFAGDPILALVEVFNADPRPNKVNLSIGIYFDEQGRIPVMRSVQLAEARCWSRRAGRSPTCRSKARPTSARRCSSCFRRRSRGAGQPAAWRRSSRWLVRWPEGRRRLHQALVPNSEVWVSDPTWDNHRADVRRRRHRRAQLPVLRRRRRRRALRRDAGHAGQAAGRQRGAAARLLPQPHRRGPDASAVGRADPVADPASG